MSQSGVAAIARIGSILVCLLLVWEPRAYPASSDVQVTITSNTPANACRPAPGFPNFDTCLQNSIKKGLDPSQVTLNYANIVVGLGNLCDHGDTAACPVEKQMMSEWQLVEKHVAQAHQLLDRVREKEWNEQAKGSRRDQEFRKMGCVSMTAAIVGKLSPSTYEIVGMSGEHAMLVTTRTKFASTGVLPPHFYARWAGYRSVASVDGFGRRVKSFKECAIDAPRK